MVSQEQRRVRFPQCLRRSAGLALAFTLALPALSAATDLTVRLNQTGTGPAGANCSGAATPTTFGSIQAAVTAASAGDRLLICSGTYNESVTIAKALSVLGPQAGVDARDRSGVPEAIVAPNAASAFNITQPVTVDGMTFTGATQAALLYGGNLVTNAQTVRNTVFDANFDAVLGIFGNSSVFTRNWVKNGLSRGVEMNTAPHDDVQITDNLFDNNGGEDIVFIGQAGSGNDRAAITGNRHRSGGSNFLVLQNNDDTTVSSNVIQDTAASAIVTLGGSNGATITGNRITGGNQATGISIVNLFGLGPNSGLVIRGNTITGKIRAVRAQGPAALTDELEVHFNRITGNTDGVIKTADSGGSVDAENNWWGCNGGPGTAGCDSVVGTVDFDPWLVLRLTAPAAAVEPNGTIQVTADLTRNSAGGTPAGNDFPDGTSIAFSASAGGVSPASVATAGAAAASQFTAPGVAGPVTVTSGLDNQQVSLLFAVGNVETTITKKPTRKRPKRSILRFQSSQPGSSFQCRVDGDEYGPCTSPVDVKGLPRGRHKFRVYAIAPGGQADPTPAKARFFVRGPRESGDS